MPTSRTAVPPPSVRYLVRLTAACGHGCTPSQPVDADDLEHFTPATVEQRVLAAHLPILRPPLVLDTLRLAKHVWPGLISCN